MEALRPKYFVGLDWASAAHAVCVLDPDGRPVVQDVIPHTAAGLTDLVRRLTRLAVPAEIAIAIERPSGLLVDTLVAAGFRLVPIHPNALKATRPRYAAAPGKSDPGDAYILADLLRTDGHRFRPLRPPADSTRALRAAVRTRDDLVATRIQLANQLRSLLESFWAGAAALFADIDSPIALAFLDALRPLVEQLRELEALIAAQLAQHADGPLLQSFPRTGTVNAAQLLAELGEDRGRFPTAAQLAAEAGVAPVTRSSGKHCSVACRFACNKRLRQAATTWADNSRHANPWAAAVYRQARARGCDHPHAVRILARAWLRVLWRCWQARTPYNPAQHGRALPFLVSRPPTSRVA